MNTAIFRYISCTEGDLDALLAAHAVDAEAPRCDDFEAFFLRRTEALCHLIEKAMGKEVQQDLEARRGHTEDTAHFAPEDVAVDPEDEDF